ncbi:tRNA pseudouridine(38-40) synthase TruA [Sulfurovum sp. NBC37-1]|uniref:tRNA pseudouridine(38-40) synthase TruA n=1 Tax=Sulfurovum sp. (strain NBC37-1) TaxID=387093 RepID=UPI0001587B33|nr:tRNA pseudouridine(38-40) synthase TruA [Sulfurovum sp. NBC37-1]BAF72788.1 tRNA pseudouridine synthase A [Sulfurovum sp. NBC37-1]
MRVKAVIAYDGSAFQGFQKQTRTNRTVTTTIENALADLQIISPLTGSGRTDAGVHASGQVIHFDLPEFWSDLNRLKNSLNKKLSTIRFKHISAAPDDFHARFSAKKRIYRYIFKENELSVFERKYVAHYSSFDPDILKRALLMFVGEHDFIYFHKTGSDIHTTVRKIYDANYRQEGKYHFLYFTANGFLRSQVRMMVESAMLCAQNELTLEQLQKQINAEKRYHSRLSPPEGLYLARILY